jgi:malate synthase
MSNAPQFDPLHPIEPASPHAAMVSAGRSSVLLTAEALHFLTQLQRQFGARRVEILRARSGLKGFSFLDSTDHIRRGAWRVAPVPECILDRRVEITGPAEPKMIINALNSGAKVFMADFEDSLSPTWNNIVTGHEALHQAVRRTLRFTNAEGKNYQLNDSIAQLFVRPRGWHLSESHLRVDGEPMSASLFDFGLFFFHNAAEQLRRGVGPFFYLPKMESHLEARLWNEVFCFAQEAMNISSGSIKATCLIETLPAAFEMDEILYELREHSAGLNCGRWDYIFSFIKKQPTVLLPDRSQLTMDKGFLRAYSQLLIETCHRRGAHAMGGMAAQIPIKDNPVANEAALSKVRADKLREVKSGHDGTWVAHPALVPIAQAIFDEHLKTPHQINSLHQTAGVTKTELLGVPEGTRTDAGLRQNVRVGVQYLEAWLRGQGCVPIENLMEDAATAEISRAQVWQQMQAGLLSKSQLLQVMDEELHAQTTPKLAEAKALFLMLSAAPVFEEFLTISAYQQLLASEI